MKQSDDTLILINRYMRSKVWIRLSFGIYNHISKQVWRDTNYDLYEVLRTPLTKMKRDVINTLNSELYEKPIN